MSIVIVDDVIMFIMIMFNYLKLVCLVVKSLGIVLILLKILLKCFWGRDGEFCKVLVVQFKNVMYLIKMVEEYDFQVQSVIFVINDVVLRIDSLYDLFEIGLIIL